MATQVDTVTAEARIRQRIDDWAQAARDKDLDALMSFYAPDIVSFDVIPPLQYAGAEAYRKDWEMGFEMCQGETDFEMRDLHVTAGTEAAFCYWLNRMSGTTKDQESFDCWVRWTQCWQKVAGKWLIAHEHISFPIDMKTNSALMDLKP